MIPTPMKSKQQTRVKTNKISILVLDRMGQELFLVHFSCIYYIETLKCKTLFGRKKKKFTLDNITNKFMYN